MLDNNVSRKIGGKIKQILRINYKCLKLCRSLPKRKTFSGVSRKSCGK